MNRDTATPDGAEVDGRTGDPRRTPRPGPARAAAAHADPFDRLIDAVVVGLGDLRADLRETAADLRAEARSTRMWMAGLVALAIVVVGGVVGVSVAVDLPGVGGVTTEAP